MSSVNHAAYDQMGFNPTHSILILFSNWNIFKTHISLESPEFVLQKDNRHIFAASQVYELQGGKFKAKLFPHRKARNE